MYANFHTHTYLCRHASGEPEEYVKTAIKNGLKVLGFSDHVPYPFTNGYHSGFRMEVSETPLYVNMIAELKNKYKDQIKIYIGYEAEYYPEFFDKMLENIKGCDYIILGQHCTFNEYDGVGSGAPTDDKSVFIQYVNQVCEAVDTGKFTYVAHPDLIGYRGDTDFYREYMTKLCMHMKEKDIPLEINLLGLSENRPYPYEEFWKIASKCGNKAILGCDAHEPKMTGNKKLEALGRKYADKFGIELLEDTKFRKV